MANELAPLTGAALEAYVDAVARLDQTQADIAIYVYTGYGQRAQIDVLRDLWVQQQSFSGVTAVFFDEVAATSSAYDYYNLLAYAANLFELDVIFNPGLPPADKRFYDIGGVIVVSENTQFVNADVAAVVRTGIPGTQIAGLQYASADSQLTQNFSAILASGAKFAYVTEYGTNDSNPWAMTSSAYADYVSIAAAQNARILLPLYSEVSLWEGLLDLNGAYTTVIVNPNNGRITGGDSFTSPPDSQLLIAGDGHDFMLTTQGSSEFYGESGNDFLLGGPGEDLLSGGSGNDLLIGGEGRDHALYNGESSAFSWFKTGREIKITDKTGLEGSDRLLEVERVHFSNISIAFDVTGTPQTAMRLLQTLTGHNGADNPVLLGQVMTRVDWGFSDLDLANAALEALNLTDPMAVLNLAWRNVFGQNPDQETLLIAQNLFDEGFTPGELVALGMNRPEITAKIDLVGIADTGLMYVPVA